MVLMGRHGAGTLYLRRRDNRWVAQVVAGRKRPSAACSHPNHRPTDRTPCPEARALLAELVRLRDARVESASPRRSLAAYLRGWLDEVRPRLAPATWRKYESIARNHLVPALGHKRLSELSVGEVQQYLDVAVLHPQSVRHHRATLRRALADAVRDGLVTRNVAALAEPPRMERRERPYLTAPQARTLIEGTRDTRLGPLFHLAVGTGLREAEILGLAWQDIDLDAGILEVRSTLQRVDGEWQLREPKTPKSRRSVPLSKPVVASLRAHKKRQLEDRVGAGGRFPAYSLVFTTRSGWPMYAWHVLEALYAAEERLALPRVGLHGLRHTFATIALANGENPRVVADILGHSSVRVTLDIYSHVMPQSTRGAIDRIAEVVG